MTVDIAIWPTQGKRNAIALTIQIMAAARLAKQHKTKEGAILVGAIEGSFEALPVVLMPGVSGKREDIQTPTFETREEPLSALNGKQMQFAAVPGPPTSTTGSSVSYVVASNDPRPSGYDAV